MIRGRSLMVKRGDVAPEIWVQFPSVTLSILKPTK